MKHKLNSKTKDIKIVYAKANEIVIKYNEFLKLLNLIEDKQIEKNYLHA